MNPTPTGRLSTTDGSDLLLSRSFRAPIEDVWASITEPERTARWFASWTGDAGPGKTIRYRLTFEEGAPEADMLIEACEPPHRLAVRTGGAAGEWHLEARLVEADGVTELTLAHHLDEGAPLGEVGPGWEYYLDLLVSAREGTPQPQFDDYYPSQQAYYESLR